LCIACCWTQELVPLCRRVGILWPACCGRALLRPGARPQAGGRRAHAGQCRSCRGSRRAWRGRRTGCPWSPRTGGRSPHSSGSTPGARAPRRAQRQAAAPSFGVLQCKLCVRLPNSLLLRTVTSCQAAQPTARTGQGFELPGCEMTRNVLRGRCTDVWRTRGGRTEGAQRGHWHLCSGSQERKLPQNAACGERDPPQECCMQRAQAASECCTRRGSALPVLRLVERDELLEEGARLARLSERDLPDGAYCRAVVPGLAHGQHSLSTRSHHDEHFMACATGVP